MPPGTSSRGFVTAIRVLLQGKDVDARDKPAHEAARSEHALGSICASLVKIAGGFVDLPATIVVNIYRP